MSKPLNRDEFKELCKIYSQNEKDKMFKSSAPQIKRFCKECGNVTNLEVINIPPNKGLSYPQLVITTTVSLILIGLLELVKLYLN